MDINYSALPPKRQMHGSNFRKTQPKSFFKGQKISGQTIGKSSLGELTFDGKIKLSEQGAKP